MTFIKDSKSLWQLLPWLQNLFFKPCSVTNISYVISPHSLVLYLSDNRIPFLPPSDQHDNLLKDMQKKEYFCEQYIIRVV